MNGEDDSFDSFQIIYLIHSILFDSFILSVYRIRFVNIAAPRLLDVQSSSPTVLDLFMLRDTSKYSI
jgi:hypothetical protein